MGQGVVQEIIITWKINNDQYWLHFKIKNGRSKSKINYKQIICRDKTFFGYQDTAGLFYYKLSSNKTVKQFNKSTVHVKNHPE